MIHTTDYIANFVYEDNDLKYILTDEGRVMVNEGNTYEYQYFLKVGTKWKSRHHGNHLGNTRVTFTENGNIIQEDAYYPFGMQMNGLCHETGTNFLNKNLYNGKELQDDFGLDWYYYGARFYDATLGRWHVADPMAEQYFDLSPYNYVANNPLIFIDPNGSFIDNFEIHSSSNTYVERTDDKTDSFTYIDSKGGSHDLGTFSKNEHGLIQLNNFSYSSSELSIGYSVKSGEEDEVYMSGEAHASLLGALSENNTSDFTISSVSLADGSSPPESRSHKNGNVFDSRFLRNDRSGAFTFNFGSNFDSGRQTDLNKALNKFGWKDLISSGVNPGTSVLNGQIGWPYGSGHPAQLPYTRDINDGKHYNHLHSQGFRPYLIEVKREKVPQKMKPIYNNHL
ncbi:MAG: RHS repeat-associated core domain-containing protein [Bacteroidales bacterium]|nr:RHS repeat-associated core domain-containing protein [Bacteroidales bacterium]